jgi:hypothetical protein
MRSLVRTCVAALALLSLAAMSASALPPQSEVRLASARAEAGKTVVLPLTVTDRQGTPLGWERPFGERIQGLAFKVRALPATAVRSMVVRRAGVAGDLAPLFETSPAGQGSASLLVSFDEATALLPLSTTGRRGQPVAEVEVRLAPGLAPGAVVELRLDPGVTVLSNQGGTVVESAANGWLRLVDGKIQVQR